MTRSFDLPTEEIIATRRPRLLLRGLRTAVFSGVIAVFLATAVGMAFWPTLVHSLCIGMMCWLVIDLGRTPVARWVHRHAPPGSLEAASHWPGWPLMSVLIVVGSIIGFSAGTELAATLLGQGRPHGYFRGNWLQSAGLLAGSLVPAITITYWFYSREAMAAKEAAVLAAQRQAAEHQLKLLESQLEPHMLFNTLANLRVLIGLDPPRAQTMLDSLIAFLRATLDGSRASQHPLAAEFGRLGDYLSLMKIRMGDRLQASFDLPADLADLAVPALLLQPLVENCIQHGLEPALAGGRIAVGAARDGEVLVLTVRDTGIGLEPDPGFRPNTTARALAGTVVDTGPAPEAGGISAGNRSDGNIGNRSHFGLAQVRERLATLYGREASLRLAAAADDEGGTIATIRLPLPKPALRPPLPSTGHHAPSR